MNKILFGHPRCLLNKVKYIFYYTICPSICVDLRRIAWGFWQNTKIEKNAGKPVISRFEGL